MPEHLYATDNADFEHLLSLGFSEIEATRLVYMKDHVTEQIEYREMLEEQNRLDFVRWLVGHDRLEKYLKIGPIQRQSVRKNTIHNLSSPLCVFHLSLRR